MLQACFAPPRRRSTPVQTLVSSFGMWRVWRVRRNSSPSGTPKARRWERDEVALVADLAAIAPPGLWLRLLELVAEAEMNLRQSVDARLLVEVCLLRALRPPAADGKSAGVAALELRVAALEGVGPRRTAARGWRPVVPN